MFRTVIPMCLSAAMLAGCSSVSPAGLIAAARLDPLETSPGDIAVAVSVPEALQLRDGDAVLYLGFVPDDPAVAAPVAATVPLSVSESMVGPRAALPGERVYVFGFTPATAAQLEDVQARIKTLKAEDVQGEGTLSIGVEGGCVVDDLGDALPVATWLRTGPEAKFVTLTNATNLFDLMSSEEKAELKAEISQC